MHVHCFVTERPSKTVNKHQTVLLCAAQYTSTQDATLPKATAADVLSAFLLEAEIHSEHKEHRQLMLIFLPCLFLLLVVSMSFAQSGSHYQYLLRSMTLCRFILHPLFTFVHSYTNI